ncbi:MAG TPA: glycosyltransferase, partial [Bacteroidia bacterium]
SPVIKKENELKLYYLSRISEKKNLLYALDVLLQLDPPGKKIELNIIGNIESNSYWQACTKKISQLTNKGIAVNSMGVIKNEEVGLTISKFHFLILPTLNENYGHAIVESLYNGKPVIISDQTPWKNLEHYKAGWDIALENINKFIETIQRCLAMGNDEYMQFAKGALEYAINNCNFNSSIEETRKMFMSVLNNG